MKTTIFASFVALIFAPFAAAQCVGDIALDARVDGGDLGVLLANWGPVTSSALSHACDFDGSGKVDGADLGAMLANWGACPPVLWGNIIEMQPDPAVVTDPDLRASIVATGLPWRVSDRGTGIEMLLVPPGTFQMGCIMDSDTYPCAAFSSERPFHQVTLTAPVYLGRYEITQAQWMAKMSANPSYFFVGYADYANRPVEQVSWNIIQSYLAATHLRLPSEAEWEFACRAGTQTPFYNGTTADQTVGSIAWFGGCCGSGNSGSQTHAVGGRAPNALGFHDMLGNVAEWVDDYFAPYQPYAQTNPTGSSTGVYRVIRGGGYVQESHSVRSSARRYASPEISATDTGFRVARNP
jgi:formylglycine-generating enzyme required for sulfatase activity